MYIRYSHIDIYYIYYRWQDLPFVPYVHGCIQATLVMSGKSGNALYPKRTLHKTQMAGAKRAKHYMERFAGGYCMDPHPHEHLVEDQVIQDHHDNNT